LGRIVACGIGTKPAALCNPPMEWCLSSAAVG
jgi:hypothetical protein